MGKSPLISSYIIRIDTRDLRSEWVLWSFKVDISQNRAISGGIIDIGHMKRAQEFRSEIKVKGAEQ